MVIVLHSYALVFLASLHNAIHFVDSQAGSPKNANICLHLTSDPFFDVDYVTEKPWRVYYTWKMKMGGKCLDMSFENSSPQIVQRYQTEMSEYLQNQPNWESASLLLTIGAASHEMLLFYDQSTAGIFLGVPNIVRDAKLTPAKYTTPLLKFHMKLFMDGKYLVIADCQHNVATLSGRIDLPLIREEVSAIAQQLDLEDGEDTCYNKEENY